MTKRFHPKRIERSVSINGQLHVKLQTHADENDLRVSDIVHNEINRFFRLRELNARSN